MARYDASDVFVPGRFPIAKEHAYADRGDAQQSLSRSLSRGFVPLIYGTYGVGKSSMAHRVAHEADLVSSLVYVDSVYGKSLSDVLAQALESIGYEIQHSRTASEDKGGSGQFSSEVEGGIFGTFKAKLGNAISRTWKKGEQAEYELAVKSPTDSKVIDICEQQHIFLIIDELHRATPAFRMDLAAFIKSYANRNCTHFKICLIGTETDPGDLIVSDPGVDRILEEIALGSLSRAETSRIITSGMDRLKIKIPDTVEHHFIDVAVGSPFVAQFLCLEMAEAAISRGDRTLSPDMLSDAIQTYAKRKAERHLRHYREAIETTGPKKYRKQILHAMAASDETYVTMDEIVRRVSDQLEEQTPSSSLSGPLRNLKSEEFGPVLRDIERMASSGTRSDRVHNYSTFVDPGMKAIIRMIQQIGIDKLTASDD